MGGWLGGWLAEQRNLATNTLAQAVALFVYVPSGPGTSFTHALSARLPACLPTRLLQELRLKGFRRAAIVAGEGSYEWFAQRDFSRVGAAPQSELLPAWRQAELQEEAAEAPDLAPVQLYVKPIVELDESVEAQPGKRIGF